MCTDCGKAHPKDLSNYLVSCELTNKYREHIKYLWEEMLNKEGVDFHKIWANTTIKEKKCIFRQTMPLTWIEKLTVEKKIETKKLVKTLKKSHEWLSNFRIRYWKPEKTGVPIKERDEEALKRKKE